MEKDGIRDAQPPRSLLESSEHEVDLAIKRVAEDLEDNGWSVVRIGGHWSAQLDRIRVSLEKVEPWIRFQIFVDGDHYLTFVDSYDESPGELIVDLTRQAIAMARFVADVKDAVSPARTTGIFGMRRVRDGIRWIRVGLGIRRLLIVSDMADDRDAMASKGFHPDDSDGAISWIRSRLSIGEIPR